MQAQLAALHRVVSEPPNVGKVEVRKPALGPVPANEATTVPARLVHTVVLG